MSARCAGAWLMAAVLVGGCADAHVPVTASSSELPSPAGVGSGEPFLSSSGDTFLLSWLERVGPGEHELRYARFEGGAWGEPRVIAAGERFLVNWADFPSVAVGPDGALWAHWLERGPTGGYDYGVRVARSADDGRTWTTPWTPHEDQTPTEHGFVSMFGVAGDMGLVWLDGRRFEAGSDGAPPAREMTLMYRAARGPGPASPETVLDARVCDCCQTDAAVTSEGPVVVYRDRSPGEIRDIAITRRVDGAWTPGKSVHEDGWETGACPVNGPAVAAEGEKVAVAWFTGAAGEPLVRAAFSDDSGATFGRPVTVDDRTPAGRVDVALLHDGSALVSWLARPGGDAAEVRVRRVHPGGRSDPGLTVSATSSERASGFPRMAQNEGGTVLLAWTDVAEMESRVRVTRIDLEMEAR